MAKKNFKGGLDSLIENSLGIRKSGKKGEMRGNPIDLLPEQKQDDDKEEKDFFFKADKTEKPKKEADNKAKENAATTEIAEAPKAAEAAETAEAPKVTEVSEAAETTEAAKVTEAPEAAKTTEAAKVTEAPEAVKTTEAAEAPKVAEAAVATEAAVTEAAESEKVEVKTVIKTPTIEVEANDSEKNVFLKNLVADLRKELFLWRNGKINVQSFNATLHSHGLKYNPDNNEIEEF